MRFIAVALALLVATTTPALVVSFSLLQPQTPSSCTIPTTRAGTSTAPFRAEKLVNGVIFSGDPPEEAYEMNHYDILLQHSIQAPKSGDAVAFSDLLTGPDADTATTKSHIVVFLRSLG
jgi:hypothetical protein